MQVPCRCFVVTVGVGNIWGDAGVKEAAGVVRYDDGKWEGFRVFAMKTQEGLIVG